MYLLKVNCVNFVIILLLFIFLEVLQLMSELQQFDKEIFNSIQLELKRQQSNIELIASENFVSKAVMLFFFHFSNKYWNPYSR